MHVTVNKTGDGPQAILKFLDGLSPASLARLSCEKFKALVIHNLRQGFAFYSVYPQARLLWPCFDNIITLADGYIDAIAIEDTEDGCGVLIDFDRLKAHKIDHQVPLLIEYGDPRGVPQIPAWRLACEELELREADSLIKEVMCA